MAICHLLITFTHLADITYLLLSIVTYDAFKMCSLPVHALRGSQTCDATQHALPNEERLLVLWLFLVNKNMHTDGRSQSTQEHKLKKSRAPLRLTHDQTDAGLFSPSPFRAVTRRPAQRAGERWECVVSSAAVSGDWVFEGTGWGRKGPRKSSAATRK